MNARRFVSELILVGLVAGLLPLAAAAQPPAGAEAGGTVGLAVEAGVDQVKMHIANMAMQVVQYAPQNCTVKLGVKVRIRDETNQAVPGATVVGDWTFPDGSGLAGVVFVTDSLGVAKFTLISGQCGTHTFCVTDVTVAGYTYDPVGNQAGPCMSLSAAPRCRVPAGWFKMGCDQTKPNEYCFFDEKPLHAVWLSGYTIDKCEVTNSQYERCADALVCSQPSDFSSETRDSYYKNPLYDDYPVLYISWLDAKAYCEWAGLKLPTEAQWEKAARGTVDAPMYPWGDIAPDCSRLNYQHSDGSNWWYCVGDTTRVGSYPSGESPYHVLDMGGNVMEWVKDYYDAFYYTWGGPPWVNPENTVPPAWPIQVRRGGAWITDWYLVRTAFRQYYGTPADTSHFVGFRCVAP